MSSGSGSDVRSQRRWLQPALGSMLLGGGITVCSDVKYFNCSAVELARKVIGNYLFLAESGIVVRILETEAYPKLDIQVYTKTFAKVDASELNINGGALLARETIASRKAGNIPFIYMTAGTGAGDIVHLRSLEPVEGLEEIKIRRGGIRDALKLYGPMTVGGVFTKDLSTATDALLYTGESIQLFLKPANDIVQLFHGPRVLTKLWYDGCNVGMQEYFRFAANLLHSGEVATQYKTTNFPLVLMQ